MAAGDETFSVRISPKAKEGWETVAHVHVRGYRNALVDVIGEELFALADTPFEKLPKQWRDRIIKARAEDKRRKASQGRRK